MGWFNRKKKKQKQQEEFFKLLGDALQTANENAQSVGNDIFNRQDPDRKDFGRCEAHPIFTSSLVGTESYLSRLCTKDGSKFTWSGYTSIRATVRGHKDVGEDVYTLYLNGEKYTNIYVVPYVGESKFPPAGLYFCDDDTDWDLEREAFGKGITVAQLLELRKLEEEVKNEKLKAQVIHFTDCYSQSKEENVPIVVECPIESSPAPSDEKLFCRKCGTRLPLDSIFCNKCGAKVEAKPVHNEPPVYIDSLFSLEKEHVGKYVQLIGEYSWFLLKKEPLKCNISQYSMRGDMSVSVELVEPLPDYVVNASIFERQPIILRGILDETTKPYHEYILKDAEYQGYWREETGKIRCMKDSCEHKCSNDCPIHLNKLGKEKHDEYLRDEAIELFKRAVFLTPDFAEAWCNLGYAYLDSQKYNNAYEAFCEAEKYGPNNERTMYGEIVSFSKVGRQKEAQDLLKKYQKLFPNKNSETLSKIIS